MKKIFALIIVSVFSASIAVAQVNNHRTAVRPHFERLDSATRSKLMKSHKEFWMKQVKENDKKWKTHMAKGPRQWKAPWQHSDKGFLLHPQEQMPVFIGGKEALMSWLEENVTYPVSANLTGIEGKVLVAFDVNADGTVGNVHVKESANPLLESEVVSKLQEMPRWIPAFQNGRAVKVKYTLPINFTQQS